MQAILSLIPERFPIFFPPAFRGTMPGNMARKPNATPAVPILSELDKYVLAAADTERRVCEALAAAGEATFRLAVKVDRGRVVSLRLESNEDMAGPAADEPGRLR